MIEDQEVAERAVTVGLSITRFGIKTHMKPKVKISGSNLFATLKCTAHHSLIIGKLDFFGSLSYSIKPYLQILQADAPLFHFITTKKTVLLQTVKQREKVATDISIIIAMFKASETTIYVATSEFDIRFMKKATLAPALREKNLSQL